MKKDRRLIIFILLIIMLTINFITMITNQLDYEKRKESGNERWKQVEARIEEIERCCDERNR